VESQIDPSADGLRIDALHTVNGVSASAGNVDREREPGAITLVMGARDSSAKVSALRTGSMAVLAFQIGYTLLDRVEFPLTFARTAPLHIAAMVVGIVAFMTGRCRRARCETGAS
jgi:hypothetical protein